MSAHDTSVLSATQQWTWRPVSAEYAFLAGLVESSYYMEPDEGQPYFTWKKVQWALGELSKGRTRNS